MSEPALTHQVVTANSGFDVVLVDAHRHAHQHMLRALNHSVVHLPRSKHDREDDKRRRWNREHFSDSSHATSTSIITIALMKRRRSFGVVFAKDRSTPTLSQLGTPPERTTIPAYLEEVGPLQRLEAKVVVVEVAVVDDLRVQALRMLGERHGGQAGSDLRHLQSV